MFERILVAYDGSEHAKKALALGIDLAKVYNSRLYIVEAIDESIFYNTGVLPPLSAIKDLEKKVRKDVEEATEIAKKEGAGTLREVDIIGEVIEGDPATAILDFADKNSINLIIIGSRGLSRFKRVVLGSVSSVVLNHSKIPVMIVK